MKNIEKYIMWIFILIAIGAIGAAVYFGISADKDNSKKEENKQEEVVENDKKENSKLNESLDNKDDFKDNGAEDDDTLYDDEELISFCKSNKNSIILKIEEFRKTNFMSKYYPSKFSNNVFSYNSSYLDNGKEVEISQSYSIANASDIDCSSVHYDDNENENVIIIPFKSDSELGNGGIEYNFAQKSIVSEYVTDMEGDYDLNEYFSFIYAKDKMRYDLDLEYNYPGIYAQEYDGGDTRKFSVCNYETGGEKGCLGEKYAVYEYNYKTDAYYKIK